MKILVTGATGFIGQHLVAKLLDQKHEVIATARDIERAKKINWFENVTFIASDLHDPALDPVNTFGVPDVLIHLAWPGLPNYNGKFHLDENLPADCSFLKNMILAGTKHILVTGTCLEYGMQEGALSEDIEPIPTTPYGIAKDKLRRFLEDLQAQHSFTLQWVRLFYMFGPGQNPNSLIAQLDRAIDNNDESFDMSGGEQQRDYMPIEDIAGYLGSLVEHSECSGIINCCSGKPITVRHLVEERIAKRGSDIKLNFGIYPYPEYEPMSFWGDNGKLEKCINNKV